MTDDITRYVTVPKLLVSGLLRIYLRLVCSSTGSFVPGGIVLNMLQHAKLMPFILPSMELRVRSFDVEPAAGLIATEVPFLN